MQNTNETNMKTLMPKLLIGLCALILLASPHLALAQTQGGLTVDNFNDAANESSGLTSTLYTVTHYALYIFYLLGIIFMGASEMLLSRNGLSSNTLDQCQTGHRSENCAYIRPVFDWDSS